MIGYVGISTLICSSEYNNMHQIAVLTTQTNLVGWTMAHHLQIKSNTFIYWVPQSLSGLKAFWQNEVHWENSNNNG